MNPEVPTNERIISNLDIQIRSDIFIIFLLQNVEWYDVFFSNEFQIFERGIVIKLKWKRIYNSK